MGHIGVPLLYILSFKMARYVFSYIRINVLKRWDLQSSSQESNVYHVLSDGCSVSHPF